MKPTHPKIYHFGVSGGKDSTALLIWAFHLSGYPKEAIRVTFCDTGNELKPTYEYVRYLSDLIVSWGGEPILWLYPDLDFYDLARKKKRFPSAKARFCTEELKLIPAKRYLQWLEEGGSEVLNHTGVRAAESPDRAALPEWGIDFFNGVSIHRPLLGYKLAQVWELHERYNVKPNPLYEDGFLRVGCGICCMNRKSGIAIAARKYPEAPQRIGRVEDELGTTFFHASTIPLRYRSKTIVTKEKKGKDLRELKGDKFKLGGLFIDETFIQYDQEPRLMAVGDIYDVVRWATSEDPDEHLQLDFDEEFESRGTCASESGACE